MSTVHFKKNWKRITYYINLHCTFQTKWILKILEDELRSLLVANNEVGASITVNSEQLEKEQELSEFKTKKQEFIINLQKKRNEALWEFIIRAKTDLNKRMKLWQLYRSSIVCQKTMKVSKTTMAQLELEESKVTTDVQFWKELMNKLYIQEHFSCKLFFIIHHAIYNI